jgi:tRNA(Ile)-lysidine synthase
LRVVHVDHGLQPASAAWAEHCRAVCEALGVPCLVERIAVRRTRGDSTESAARRIRYAVLAGHVGPREVLLTAHHRDDQAETVLLQLLRGAGPHGLAAMPSVAPFGAGRHARPLLAFRRQALAAYARREGLRWIEDTSNVDLGIARNFIRHRVLPLLEAHRPGAVEALARAAANAAEAAALLDGIAETDLASCESGPALKVSGLNALPLPRRRNLLRYWIRRRGFRAPPSAILEQVLDQSGRETRSGLAAVRWPGGEVRRYRGEITVHVPEAAPDPRLDLPWVPPAPLDIPGIGRLRAAAATGEGLSQARLAGKALRVRLRRGGESCRLPGKAHRHKLKKLLQERGLPPWERRRLPLIYAGEELAAVGDLWVCEPYAARPGEPGWRLVLERFASELSQELLTK